MSRAHYFCFRTDGLYPVPYWLHGCVAFCLQGVSKAIFSSHSFRIGAATVAARNGIPDHQIQALGRWTSSAYLLYIRTPAELLSQLSKQLSLLAAHWRFTSGPSGSVFACSILCSKFSERDRAACCLLGFGLVTVSAALESLPLRLAAFVGYTLIRCPEIYRLLQHAFSFSELCLGGVCIDYIFLFRSVGFGAWKLGRLGPSSTLFAGPSFSKHLGGKGMVVAAHRVVMDTLRVRLGVTRGPTFLISSTIPQAYLLWWV